MVIHKLADMQRDKAISRLEKVTKTHSSYLIAINRHLEDLDNSGRRNNIRVRGIPETVTAEQIKPALQSIFTHILEGPADTVIDFYRAHKALKPKGAENTLPRDIICCVTNFPSKEDIF